MSLNGEVDGAPMKTGIAISDMLAGANALQAILAALFARSRTGRGQAIDISLLDSSIAALSNVASAALNAGRGMERYGNAHASIVPYQSFRTADGDIVVAVGSDRQFRDFCNHVLERPDLAADPRLARNPDRVEHRVELIETIAGLLRALPTATVVARAKQANVPTGEVRDVPTALAAPEIDERGMIATFETADGPMRLPASPLGLRGTPPTMRSAPPSLGQHSREVLSTTLGLDASVLDDLAARGVI
jgi:crotonobetainyl-CoA:carnitine CoA-transferase CaiB-like acyl-CoA transferase